MLLAPAPWESRMCGDEREWLNGVNAAASLLRLKGQEAIFVTVRYVVVKKNDTACEVLVG